MCRLKKNQSFSSSASQPPMGPQGQQINFLGVDVHCGRLTHPSSGHASLSSSVFAFLRHLLTELFEFVLSIRGL